MISPAQGGGGSGSVSGREAGTHARHAVSAAHGTPQNRARRNHSGRSRTRAAWSPPARARRASGAGRARTRPPSDSPCGLRPRRRRPSPAVVSPRAGSCDPGRTAP
eukprot:scaffold96783_cov75-Phaeocystis_antarctica.AAC.2